jgi:hypothetical protein
MALAARPGKFRELNPQNRFAGGQTMKRVSDWLYHLSSGWLALAGVTVFLLFSALVLPAQSARADPAGAAAGSPDLSFYYTPQDLLRWAEAYGEGGRAEYIRARFSFDLIWPLVYTFFLGSSISWLWGRALPPVSLWRRVNLLPLLAMLFDLLENSATSLVMARYPAETALAAGLAPLFTAVKWLLVGSSFIALCAGVALNAWRRAQKQER